MFDNINISLFYSTPVLVRFYVDHRFIPAYSHCSLEALSLIIKVFEIPKRQI